MFIIRRWPVPLSVKIRTSSRVFLNNFYTADTTNLLSINAKEAEEKMSYANCSSAITARYSLFLRTT